MDSEPAFLPLHAAPAIREAAAVAIVLEGEHWSWGRLDRRAGQWAAHLRAAGVGADDLVAFALQNGPEFIALTFGIYRAGATPAPLSPKLADGEMREIIALMQPAAVVGTHPVLAGRSLPAPSADGPVAPPAAHVARSWKACTSGGSTGRPKVIVDGRPAALPADADFIGIPGDGSVFVPGPLYHNATFSAAVFALWKGATLVLASRFDAAEALATIGHERVRWALMVPTMMHRILRLPPETLLAHDLSRWEMVVHTAARMPEETKRAWIDLFGADHVWEVYGATEGLFRTWIGGREWLAHPGSVGRSEPGFSISIRDEAGVALPPGVPGEIFGIPPGGPGSSYRYVGAERRVVGDGWESVGDQGWLDEDGYLYLLDRRTDLIISGGVNIWPAEVEAAILRHPAVRSCAVIGLPDEDLGSSVHAVIECGSDAPDLAALRAFLAPHLSAQKMPKSLSCSAEPVRDDAGKVRKSLLRDQVRSLSLVP